MGGFNFFYKAEYSILPFKDVTLVKNSKIWCSVLGLLLFVLFINDLYQPVEFSSVHHFADDTNLLVIESSLNKINKHQYGLKANCVDWIRANKLSLNASKTEIMIFKARNKTITKHLNFRIIGQKIEPSFKFAI